MIIKRRNDNDFEGIRLSEAGYHSDALPLLENAVEAEPNNFRLWEYLAESYYFSGDTLQCNNSIEQGLALHPWSERLNMIVAQKEFDRGNYQEALEKCLEIVDGNSKYYNIVPLLAACYEKTGDIETAARLREKIR